MTRLLALILLAGPAAAETHALNSDGSAFVSYVEKPGPEIAEITFQNRLTGCTGWCQTEIVLSFDGVIVVLTYYPGNAPDTMHVTPPTGFIAIPDQVSVGEDRQGVVLIFEAGLS